MRHVIEDAEKENQVEDANRLGRQVQHSDLLALDPGIADAVDQVETRLRPPARPAPAEVIRGQPSPGAAPLRLVREESIPGADVEDAHPAQVVGHPQGRELFRSVVFAWGDYAVAQVDAVKPPDPGDLAPDLVWSHSTRLFSCVAGLSCYGDARWTTDPG